MVQGLAYVGVVQAYEGRELASPSGREYTVSLMDKEPHQLDSYQRTLELGVRDSVLRRRSIASGQTGGKPAALVGDSLATALTPAVSRCTYLD